MLNVPELSRPAASDQPAGAPRRTFAIISHPDAGKTTLTEKLLQFGGAIQMAGQVRARGDRRRTRSDWLEIERARGISVTSSVMTFEHDGNRVQPARHAGPRRLQRGHLSHAERGRRRRHGDRRREGDREPDPQAVRGLPPARHPDHHLHQQDRPRGARSARAARRDFVRAGARPDPADLAGRHGRRFPRRARHRRRAAAASERKRERTRSGAPSTLASIER